MASISHLPQWLQSCLQDSHLSYAVKLLDSREIHRESARLARTASHSSRSSLPLLDDPSSVSPRLADHYSCSVGQRPAHKGANRYLHIEPYNRTRVLIPNLSPDELIQRAGDATELRFDASDARYINANWVREIMGGKWWIVGQAPLPNTAHAFLSLTMLPIAPPPAPSPTKSSVSPLRARRPHTIVQLTQPIEGNRLRAHPYFPAVLLKDAIIQPEFGCKSPAIRVRAVKAERIDSAQCVKTELRLRWWMGGSPVAEECEVTHLLYTGWPDFDVPEDNRSILNFARFVERVNNRHLPDLPRDPNDTPPILVHCSAGIGRSGSFVSLCSLLRAYSFLSPPGYPSSSHKKPSLAPPFPTSPLGPLPTRLNGDLLAHEIDGLREQRPGMVQTKAQAAWVYHAFTDAFHQS